MVLLNRQAYRDVLESLRSRSSDGGCSVILFVAPECDALCACHIITHMLRIEHIQYKIRPASGLMDLQNANETLVKDNEELRTIVLINCTGGFDITKVFPLTSSQR